MKKTTKHCALLDERFISNPLKHITLHVLSQSPETTSDNCSVKKNTFSEYNPSKLLRTLRVQDFSITSLLSVGADLHLTSLSMDNHTAVDSLKTSLAKIDSCINKTNA